MCVDSAARQSCVQLVEQLGDSRRRDACNQPAAHGEAAIRFHQMLAATAHAAAYWDGPADWQPWPPVGTRACRDSRERAAGSL